MVRVPQFDFQDTRHTCTARIKIVKLTKIKVGPKIILFQFYGHHHTDTFKLFNSGDEIVSSAFLSPAITPWRSTLSTETGSNNPGLRLVKYNNVTGEVSIWIYLNWFLLNLRSSCCNFWGFENFDHFLILIFKIVSPWELVFVLMGCWDLSSFFRFIENSSFVF